MTKQHHLTHYPQGYPLSHYSQCNFWLGYLAFWRYDWSVCLFHSVTAEEITTSGTFTSLYKFLINSLPILIPAINPRDVECCDLEASLAAGHPTSAVEFPFADCNAHLALSKRAQEILVRKKTRKWHAALAGAVAGGLAIIWEARSRRGVIAQQMFVRCVYLFWLF